MVRFNFDEINAVFDNDANIHSVFGGGEGDQKYVYYICINKDGSIKIPLTEIYKMPMMIRYDNFRIEVDKSGNVHILILMTHHLGSIERYVMLSPKAEISKEIDINIYRGKDFKRLKIYQDTSLIAYRYGACGQYERRPTNFCQIFYLKDLNDNVFSQIFFTVTFSYRNFGVVQADFIQLNSDRLLVLAALSDIRESYLHSFQVDLDKQATSDINTYEMKDNAYIIYKNPDPDIVFGKSTIVEKGDSLLFFMKRPYSREVDPNVNDSLLYVFLIDGDGNIISNGNPEIRKASYRSLPDVKLGDLICRDKWRDPPMTFSKKGAISRFGIFSFRNFPDLIIDMGDD